MFHIAPSILLMAFAGELDCPVFLWDNLVTIDGITADQEDADFPATNLSNPQTSSPWKSGSTAGQDIVFDVAPMQPIDGIGIARHNFGSGSVGVKIYGITAEPGAVFVLLADLAPGDDSPIFAIVEPDYYVQVKISLEPGTVEPQAAVIYIGSVLTMPRSTPAGFVLPKDGVERETLNGFAENGDFLGDIITSERLTTTIDFKLLEGDWYRATMRAFVQSSLPFFYAFSPVALPGETAFAKFNGVPKGQVNQFTGQVDVSIPITGLAL
jgi:hypothetical protein